MSSEAAQEAYPDEPIADGVMRVSRESHRVAFDRGAVEALRQAAERMRTPRDGVPYEVWAWFHDWLNAQADEWEAGQ